MFYIQQEEKDLQIGIEVMMLSYQSELKEFHSKMPVDDKDKFGEEVLNYAEPCIKITEKAVKEIVGDNKLVCERYVDHAEKLMIKKIVGRIDYETKHTFIELKKQNHQEQQRLETKMNLK